MKSLIAGAGTRSTSDMAIKNSEFDRLLCSRLMEFDSLPSTNEYCKSDEIRGNRIILAHSQSAGHGRMGRSFSSKSGGLYVSFLYELDDVKPESLLPITGMCAVAVLRAIKKASGVTPDIKWTNDLLLEGKKICGILAETVFGSSGKPEKLIIGIGINVNQHKDCFAGELEGIASSLYLLTGREYDKMLLLRTLAAEIEKVYFTAFSDNSNGNRISEYTGEYRRHCMTLGKDIHILRPSLSPVGIDPRVAFAADKSLFPIAKALDIDENFGLIVRHKDGSIERIVSGEVSVK